MRERLIAWLTTAPEYPPAAGDVQTFGVLGLRLPVRATIAIVVAVFAVSFDWSRTFIPREILDLGRAAAAMRYQAIVRLVIYGAVPLAIVVGLFRDRPSRYGLQLGEWRWGLGLALIGGAVMTPVALFVGSRPEFRAYYAPAATDLPNLLLTYSADLLPAEFMFRGFLLFALVRAIGPLGVLVATMPFVFGHLSKPELELFSTLLGGLVYGWLNWKTGSILWSGLAHIWIFSMLITAAGGGG